MAGCTPTLFAATDQRLTVFNIYRSMLHSLTDVADLEFVINAIARLLSNVHEADNTYLPYSTKQVHIRFFLLCLTVVAPGLSPA